MKTSAQIRQAFFDFFKSKQHQIVSSAPMVLKNDPTLMFTNAGMNQFKDIFLGNKPVSHARIANTQKCLRVSGKHNDLEEVGHDTYHHTMFEMLGNWSFGDYFKQEAIEWAFELLTEVYGISPDILYATYFEGDASEQLEADAEAGKLWANFLPEERILTGNKKDNFWEMGESGPCGPCSEIHVDLRTEDEKKSTPGHLLVNKDHPQVIEIWNLVFIQFNRDMQGKLHPLKHKHVDTGMGFERLCRVIQGKFSNYDTDVFTPVIHKLEEVSGMTYGRDEKADVAFRVVADHLRAVSFSIADGQIPSNVKAGYVIRRILRRAVRYGYTFLNLNSPFVSSLIPVFIDQMGGFFPELEKQKQLIEKVIFEEEQSFLKTLETGIQKFENYLSSHPDEKVVDGKFAFELYDTYGFPPDLTELMCREKGFTVDMDTFTNFLNEQKERSRKDAEVEKEDWTVLKHIEKSDFVGWDYMEYPVNITRYRKVSRKGNVFYHLVFDKTPFYGESGGQTGDSGVIIEGDEKIKIISTVKEIDLTIHICEQLPSDPEKEFTAIVDKELRISTMRNHSATHLMHFALRKTLGTHVEQKGSLVTPDYLRFDFSHFQKMSSEEIEQVELIVNEMIMGNTQVCENRNISYKDAVRQGAIALFGEKYDDTVRTIRFGDSVELCGGTHVPATGNIGLFKIVSESAIAAGIRRIEAVTGEKATKLMLGQWKAMQKIKALFNNPKDIEGSIEKMHEHSKKLEKRIEELELSGLGSLADEILKGSSELNGVSVLQKVLSIPSSHIKTLAFELKKRGKCPFYFVIGNESDGKASVSVIISDDLVKEKGLHAGNIVKEAAKEINGGGGGQPGLATAGGTNPQGLDNAIKNAIAKIRALASK
jgi:alanyl-tRNA synthetase